ncbi:hypothetical protein [Thalassoglobus sp.]|uniref:hypothetical protein n=1 Tax=Thalassoglobus sp. TaxID=2795869 RepID=UPI003AA962FC
MARTEADREDLYEEFRSATKKWELELTHEDSPIVLGIRKDNRLSLYFGPDPCFHYDSHNLLLRAYKDGALFRTQGHTLARLVRTRTSESTTLNRTNLAPADLTQFLSDMNSRITEFLNAITKRKYRILRTNSDEEHLNEAANRLQEISQLENRLAPAYPTKRK